MKFGSWLRGWLAPVRTGTLYRASSRRARVRLAVEALEDRALPSVTVGLIPTVGATEGNMVVVNSTSPLDDANPGATFHYVWTVTTNRPATDPPFVPPPSVDAPSFSFLPDEAGIYNVGLTVTEDGHPLATASATSLVTAAPLLSAGLQGPNGDDSQVSFTASATGLSSYDGFNYSWSVNGNPNYGFTVVGDSGPSSTIAFVPGSPGPYLVSVSIASPYGGSQTIDHTFVVTGDPNDPFDGGSSTQQNATIAQDNDTVSAPENLPATNTGTFTPDFDGIVTFSASTGTVTQDNVHHTWSWSGTGDENSPYPVTITMTTANADGSTGIATTTFGVSFTDVAPTVSATRSLVTAPPNGTATNTGTYADFDDTVSVAGKGVVDHHDGTWSWSGATGTVPYDVTVTATNVDGATASTTFHVAIFKPIDLQLMGSAKAPTQAGYTGVLPTAAYSAAAGYGWFGGLPDGSHDLGVAGLKGPYANLLRGDQSGEEGSAAARTFQVDVPNGPYYVSVKMGDKQSAGALTVTNADNGQVLVDNQLTPAGSFTERGFVVDVTDGSLDLTFSDTNSGNGHDGWFVNGLDVRPISGVMSEGFATLGPVLADGGTIDSVLLRGASPNAEVTVASTAGTIKNADIDPDMLGTQVRTNAAGQVLIQVQRPTGGVSATVSFEEVSGARTGQGTIIYALPTVRKLDFVDPKSPLQAPAIPASPGGWIPVLASAGYTANNGYGWVSGPIDSFDRGAVAGDSVDSNLLRGGNDASSGISNAGTFRVDLPNGTYQVTVIQGDKTQSHSQENVAVTVGSGAGLSNVANSAGQWADNSFTATVNSGQLQLQFSTDALNTWVVNGLYVRPLSTVANVTFKGPGAVVGDGASIDTITGFVGAGHTGAVVTVTTSLGSIATADSNNFYAGVQVAVDATGHFTFKIKRPATAGTPTLTVTALDGSIAGSVSAPSVLTYTPPKPVGSARFAFIGGAYTAPTGFVGVHSTTVYTLAQSYGWLAPVNPFDRTTAPGTMTVNLYRGGASDAGSEPGTFQIAEAPGTDYNLRVYLYDATHSWTNLAVTVGGNTQTVASLPAGTAAYVVFTHVTAPANELIDVTFSSTDQTWIGNGLDIWPSSGVDPGQAPQQVVGGQARTTAPALTVAQLAPIVQQAMLDWTAAGLSAAQQAILNSVQFQIVNLGHGVLSQTGMGMSVVTLDATADGYGWFIDPAPATSTAFSRRTAPAEFTALPGSPAYGHVDLLTVVEHELGHVLGLDDANPQQVGHDIMTATLATGVRRVATAADVAKIAVIGS
jgi:hypothetical protein